MEAWESFSNSCCLKEQQFPMKVLHASFESQLKVCSCGHTEAQIAVSMPSAQPA